MTDSQLLELPFATPPVTCWRISARWAATPHNCTLSHILSGCGASCCRNTYWPASSNGGICAHLGERGCTMAPMDRPVTCLLYPLRLNSHGMLVKHQRAVFAKGICKGAHGCGPPLIDALEMPLVTLFGGEQYDRARADVMNGKDGRFYPGPALLAAVLEEKKWERQNLIPRPRSSSAANIG